MMNASVGRFNVIRRLIIAIMVFGFIGFLGFKLLPKWLEYITIFYVLFFCGDFVFIDFEVLQVPVLQFYTARTSDSVCGSGSGKLQGMRPIIEGGRSR